MSFRLFLLACLLVAAQASKDAMQLKPTKWLSASDLESVPSLNDITWERLESQPLEQGAKLIEKICEFSKGINQKYFCVFSKFY